MKHLAALVLALATVPACAQFKCTGADGRVSFQQQPCEAGAAAKRLELPPPAPDDGRAWARAAMARGLAAEGLTRTELAGMWPLPDKCNATYSGGKKHEQCIWRRHDKTTYVYFTDGIVTGSQESFR